MVKKLIKSIIAILFASIYSNAQELYSSENSCICVKNEMLEYQEKISELNSDFMNQFIVYTIKLDSSYNELRFTISQIINFHEFESLLDKNIEYAIVNGDYFIMYSDFEISICGFEIIDRNHRINIAQTLFPPFEGEWISSHPPSYSGKIVNGKVYAKPFDPFR